MRINPAAKDLLVEFALFQFQVFAAYDYVDQQKSKRDEIDTMKYAITSFVKYYFPFWDEQSLDRLSNGKVKRWYEKMKECIDEFTLFKQKQKPLNAKDDPMLFAWSIIHLTGLSGNVPEIGERERVIQERLTQIIELNKTRK